MKLKTFQDARHLCIRLGLGAEHHIIDAWVGGSLENAMADLFSTPAVLKLPNLTSAHEYFTKHKENQPLKRDNAQPLHNLKQQEKADKDMLVAWWLEHMRHTSTPLIERMVLFMHDIFASDLNNVKVAALMYQQNAMFRQHALGNFADLLRDAVRDPALLIQWQNTQNRIDNINPLFAKTFLTQFTLGKERFTEEDLATTARAFTGYSINAKNGQFIIQNEWHDASKKKFMGAQGHFDGDHILDQILLGTRFAESIATKCWHHFINLETPDPNTISRWAINFRDDGYEIKTLLMAIVTSPEFWAKENRATLVKSPLELSIGLLRELDLNIDDSLQLWETQRSLGQALFEHKDPNSWGSGTHWLTPERLKQRQILVHYLSRELNPLKPHHANQLTTKSRKLPRPMSLEKTSDWLLAGNAMQPLPKKNNTAMTIAHLVNDPSYQLR